MSRALFQVSEGGVDLLVDGRRVLRLLSVELSAAVAADVEAGRDPAGQVVAFVRELWGSVSDDGHDGDHDTDNGAEAARVDTINTTTPEPQREATDP